MAVSFSQEPSSYGNSGESKFSSDKEEGETSEKMIVPEQPKCPFNQEDFHRLLAKAVKELDLPQFLRALREETNPKPKGNKEFSPR